MTPLKSKWKYIGLALILIVAIIIAAFFFMSPSKEGAEQKWLIYKDPVMKYVGGKYNTSLSLLARLGEFESGDIIYTRNGVEHKGYFFSGFTPALDYLKENSPDNSTVLAWWDYGNMIIGYGEREAIATNPSEKILVGVTTNNSTNIVTDTDYLIEDIGRALTTNRSSETLNILSKYDAKYILVTTGPLGDEGKAKWIFFAGGISLDDMDQYWTNGKIVSQGRNTILYKMLNEMNVDGFKLIFSDQNTRIYQATS